MMDKASKAILIAVLILLAALTIVEGRPPRAGGALNVSKLNSTANTTNAAAPYSTPGYEGIFAIIGLIAASCLIHEETNNKQNAEWQIIP